MFDAQFSSSQSIKIILLCIKRAFSLHRRWWSYQKKKNISKSLKMSLDIHIPMEYNGVVSVCRVVSCRVRWIKDFVYCYYFIVARSSNGVMLSFMCHLFNLSQPEPIELCGISIGFPSHVECGIIVNYAINAFHSISFHFYVSITLFHANGHKLLFFCFSFFLFLLPKKPCTKYP